VGFLAAFFMKNEILEFKCLDTFETMRGKRCMKCAVAGITPWMYEKGRVFV